MSEDQIEISLEPRASREELYYGGYLQVEDWPHARRVVSFATHLFQITSTLHQRGERDLLLLQRAALLHNAGMLVSVKGHHKHSYHLIRQAPLPDLTPEEREVVACIARYHRKALPSADHPAYATLDAATQRQVSELSALVRIADGLDYQHDGQVHRLEGEVGPKRVRLILTGTERVDIEAERAKQKADLFTLVFDRHLDVLTLRE